MADRAFVGLTAREVLPTCPNTAVSVFITDGTSSGYLPYQTSGTYAGFWYGSYSTVAGPLDLIYGCDGLGPTLTTNGPSGFYGTQPLTLLTYTVGQATFQGTGATNGKTLTVSW